MRIITLGAALALVMAGAAWADDLSDPVWTKAPDRADWAKAYPDQAAKTGAEGTARLRCTVSGAGVLESCSVLQETPAGAGFGAAALSLTGGFELATATSKGQSVAGKTVTFPMKFTSDLMRPGTVITHPSWLRAPNGADFANYWPAQARGRPGQAVVHCNITNRGLTDKCVVVSETPSNGGYGAATLLMTPSFVMNPMTVDGRPVGGAEVTIPVRWEGGGPQVSGGPLMKIVQMLPWKAAPSAGEMAAVFPKEAIGKVAQGHVVLRCHLEHDGSLDDCDTLTEAPKGAGFARAATKLVKDFKADVRPTPGTYADRIVVNLPFDFRDPTQSAPPLEVPDPTWVRTIDANAAFKMFPDAAAKAGFKSGRGVVDCGVVRDGSLADCHVLSEDPPGMGFGDAALAIAGAMQMNPWTQQGTPVEGARITLPIRLKLPEDAPEPTAPPAKP